MRPDKSVVIIFNSDGMGRAEARELREILARKFLGLIEDARLLPDAICFYADGVKLTCDGSPVLAELAALEEKGVRLVVCKTCLDFFDLGDQVRVGVVGGMTDIITAMWEADSVVTL